MVSDHLNKTTVWATRALMLNILGLVAACAAQSTALRGAQHAYGEAREDPVVVREAPVALHEAEEVLRQAEQTSDEDEVNHLAYLAQRQVEIARAEAKMKTAEAEAEQRLKERDRIALEARTREAEEARAAVEQLILELADLEAKQTERGMVLTLGDVLFDYNRASLKPGAQQNLYRLVTYLSEHPEQMIRIEGHADNTGSDSYNLDLSERRAQAVRDFLIGSGIGAERITARGLGEAYPLASNNTEAGRQQNRRVEIVLPTPAEPRVEAIEPAIAAP